MWRDCYFHRDYIHHNGRVNVMARVDVWDWLRQTGYFDDLMESVLVVVLVAVIWCGLDDIRGVTSRGLCGEKIFILHCVTASLFFNTYTRSSYH